MNAMPSIRPPARRSASETRTERPFQLSYLIGLVPRPADRPGDHAAPPLGCEVGGAVCGDRTPVVADQHRPAVAAEGLVKGARICCECPRAVTAVSGNRRRRVSPHPWGNRMESRGRQLGQQVAPRGPSPEPVQA
jgi:hypothetical protein